MGGGVRGVFSKVMNTGVALVEDEQGHVHLRFVTPGKRTSAKPVLEDNDRGRVTYTVEEKSGMLPVVHRDRYEVAHGFVQTASQFYMRGLAGAQDVAMKFVPASLKDMSMGRISDVLHSRDTVSSRSFNLVTYDQNSPMADYISERMPKWRAIATDIVDYERSSARLDQYRESLRKGQTLGAESMANMAEAQRNVKTFNTRYGDKDNAFKQLDTAWAVGIEGIKKEMTGASPAPVSRSADAQMVWAP